MEKDIVICMEHVGKTYQLGKMGGTTLQASLQSWWAMKRGKEDPNRKIGYDGRQGEHETFEALKDINCRIYEGERVGIIGRNGAGKSTMLKLLSRVTAPGAGKITLKGRVTSMLEVGTGFHGELTGRENIYMNGAILGMKKAEVDEKLEDIIEFSECREFIDTPVKRYSSGMYVKLAFAVAAYLNADIFLMDEVLAVGDMLFQKKCLNKMREISEDGKKTILYVSHNMQTIRELCERCIVLDHGQVIHDGDVNEGIHLYMKEILEVKKVYEFVDEEGKKQATGMLRMYRIEVEQPVLSGKERYFRFVLFYEAKKEIRGLHMRFTVHDSEDTVVGTGMSACFRGGKGRQQAALSFDTDMLMEGEYSVDLAIVEPCGDRQVRHAYLERAMAFRLEKKERAVQLGWSQKRWGKVRFPDLEVLPHSAGRRDEGV